MPTGTVRDLGYGLRLIEPEVKIKKCDDKCVFLDNSAIPRGAQVYDGLEVWYDVMEGTNGPQATNVRPVINQKPNQIKGLRQNGR